MEQQAEDKEAEQVYQVMATRKFDPLLHDNYGLPQEKCPYCGLLGQQYKFESEMPQA
jgi:hypothetical protein